MKKPIIIFMLLFSSVVFAQNRKIGKFNNTKFDNFKKLSFEERFKLRTERKYARIKKNLKKKDADRVIEILKKYDKKVFDLRKPHYDKMQKLRNAEYADFKKEIRLIKQGLNLREKIIQLKKQEFKELRNLGLSDEILIRILRREMRNGRNAFNRNKRFFRKMRKNRPMNRGQGMMKRGF